MALIFTMITAQALVHPPLSAIVGSGLFAVAQDYMGVRVWQGKPVNPKNSIEREDQFSWLGITMLPGGLAWTFGFLALVSGDFAADLRGGSQSLLTLVSLLFGLGACVSVICALTLLLFRRPRWCIPSRLRS